MDAVYGCPGLAVLSEFESNCLKDVNAHNVAPRLDDEEQCGGAPPIYVRIDAEFSQSSGFAGVEVTQWTEICLGFCPSSSSQHFEHRFPVDESHHCACIKKRHHVNRLARGIREVCLLDGEHTIIVTGIIGGALVVLTYPFQFPTVLVFWVHKFCSVVRVKVVDRFLTRIRGLALCFADTLEMAFNVAETTDDINCFPYLNMGLRVCATTAATHAFFRWGKHILRGAAGWLRWTVCPA